MDEDPLTRAFNSFLDLFRRREEPPPPPAPKPPLKVTSHVARDLLQNAAYFSTLPKAVAEYVTNAVDSAAPGRALRCEVTLSPALIVISDNGSGMTHGELSNFFQMHGENIQRRRGRTVRGKFGTGKSAAFGIADTLQVETVRDGLRNIVELHRADVLSARDGAPIPVRELLVDSPVSAPSGKGSPPPSGTIIRITDLQVEPSDPGAVQLYLEKLLGQHLRSHRVYVNGRLCRYRRPRSELTFDFTPPPPVAAVLGRAKCRLYVSPQELERGDNTVAVLSRGFLHAATLAGRGREPLIEYLFGEAEVPTLDDDTGPVPPFDNTRSLALNPHNPRVQVLESWLGECIDQVLAKLEEREKRRRSDRERRLLRRVAGRIKSLLDEDFQEIQASLPWASLPSAPKPQPAAASPASRDAGAGSRPRKRPSIIKRGLNWLKRLFVGQNAPPVPPARLPRGAPVEFAIRFARLGAGESRASYDAQAGILTLNRDHPQLRTAEREAGLRSVTYRMLCFDIAFTEYALAVVETLARQAAAYHRELDANALVQSILDRLGRRAAEELAPLEPGTEKDEQA